MHDLEAVRQHEEALRRIKEILRVLRLYILVKENPEFAEEFSWWCDRLSVNAQKETFTLDCVDGELAKDTLTYRQHELAVYSLSTGEQLMNDYLAEKERKRLAELERRWLREQGLAKLTEEQRRALGL